MPGLPTPTIILPTHEKGTPCQARPFLPAFNDRDTRPHHIQPPVKCTQRLSHAFEVPSENGPEEQIIFIRANQQRDTTFHARLLNHHTTTDCT